MKYKFLMGLALTMAFSVSLKANGLSNPGLSESNLSEPNLSDPSLRSPSDIEIEAGLITMLEAQVEIAKQNPNLSAEDRDLILKQTEALSERIDGIVKNIREIRRNMEAEDGKYALVAVGLSIGGETTPFKIPSPIKYIPTTGVGAEVSGGLLAIVTGDLGKRGMGLRLAGLTTRGAHIGTMEKGAKLLSASRTQVFLPSIKLFFAASALNPSGRHEFVNLSDINRRFYGIGPEGGWKLPIPFVSNIIKGTLGTQVYGAWINDESKYQVAQADGSLKDSTTTYAKNVAEFLMPELMMVSINLGFGYGQNGKSSLQAEAIVVDTFLDNGGSGSGILDFTWGMMKGAAGF